MTLLPIECSFNIAMVMLLQDLPIIHKQIIEDVHLLHQLFPSVHVQESEILTIQYLYKNYLLTYYTHKRDMSLRAVYILELQICKRLPKTQRFWKNMLCPFPKHLLSPRSFQNLLCLLVPTLSLLRSTGSWSTTSISLLSTWDMYMWAHTLFYSPWNWF